MENAPDSCSGYKKFLFDNSVVNSTFVSDNQFVNSIMKANRISLLLTLAVLLSLGSCKFIEKKGWFGKKKAAAEQAEQARRDSIRIADSLRIVEEKRFAEQARLDSLQRVREYEEEMRARYKYHVVLGSFKVPGNADHYETVVDSEGYEVVRLYSPNDFHLVSALRYDNSRDAWKKVMEFRYEGRDAWVYVDE